MGKGRSKEAILNDSRGSELQEHHWSEVQLKAVFFFLMGMEGVIFFSAADQGLT